MIYYNIDVYLRHTEMENMYTRELIELVTNDYNGNIFNFTIYDTDQKAYDLTGKTVKLIVKSEKGTVIQDDCALMDATQGKASITLPSDMFCESGIYYAELQIWQELNRITTLPFDYTVRLSLDSDDAVKADNRFSLLQQALKEVNESSAIATQAKTTAESAMATANQAEEKAQEIMANGDYAKEQGNYAKAEGDRLQGILTLEGAPQTKFDFIKNEVVNGIYSKTEKTNSIVNTGIALPIDNFTIQATVIIKNGTTVSSHLFGNYASSKGFYVVLAVGKVLKISQNGVETIVKTFTNEYYDKPITIVMRKNSTKLWLELNGVIVYDGVQTYDGGTNLGFLGYNATQGTYGDITLCNACVSTSMLTPQEIEHDFSVLNNYPSIKELHTTDAEGKTSILKLASDTDHVEDRSGRTQDQINRTFYKRACKEIPSPNGEPITVKNGEEGYVLSAEIKGQTVKSIANVDDRFRTAVGDGTIKVALAISDMGLVKPSSDYTLVTEVISNTLNGDFKLVNINTSNMMIDTNDSVPAGKTGIFIVKLRSKANLSGASQIIRHALTADSTSGSITYRSCVFEGDLTKVVKGFAPFGLVSTEAIISNNGEEYPIYANEEDKANKKVISLGGLDDTKDTLEILEDGSGIYTKKIYIDKLFNVVSTWEKTLVGASTTRWYCGLVPAKLDGSILMSSIPVSSDIVNDDRVCVGTYGNASALHIRVPNSITTRQQVTEYIKTNYPDEYIAYKLATPIIIHIPKEAMKTILTHNQTNILEAGGAVKPSSFKVTLPVDRIAEIEARLQALESTTVDVVLNK